MKLVVDLTRCQGYAQCAFLAPSAFRMRGDEALLYDPDPSDEQRERILVIASKCPVHKTLTGGIDVVARLPDGLRVRKALAHKDQHPEPAWNHLGFEEAFSGRRQVLSMERPMSYAFI